MSQTLGLIIMMNNYFHDVATALLLASGFVMWFIMKRLGGSSEEAVLRYVFDLYRSITRLAGLSLAWIIVGGIPRAIFYSRFEWANAAGRNQVPALIVKHVLAFIFVGAGAYLWFKVKAGMREIKNSIGTRRTDGGK